MSTRRVLTAGLSLVALAISVAAAPTAVAAPALEVHSGGPSHVQEGVGENIGFGPVARYQLGVENVGDVDTSGPISLQITVPAGLRATTLGGGGFSCFAFQQVTITCTRASSLPANAGRGSVGVRVDFFLNVVPGAAPATDDIAVVASGGGAPEAATYADPITIGPAPPFGIYDFSGLVADADGEPATQAGGHPAEVEMTLNFNTTFDSLGRVVPVEETKTVDVELPPGFIGDPTATPTRCSREVFGSGPDNLNPPCPPSSQVGIVRVAGLGGQIDVGRQGLFGIFNMEPPPGVPAQFGFLVNGVPTFINASLRTGGDYGITANVRNITTASVTKSIVTLWGVPADSRYDALRGSCLTTDAVDLCPAGTPRKPFLTNPTDCSAGPLTTVANVASWTNPGSLVSASFDHDVNGVPMEVEGCERIPFEPSITVVPSNPKPDSASGYDVELRVLQNDNPDGLASSHLKHAIVTLPQGVSVSPSSAHGLEACSPAQIGMDNVLEPTCPEASKIGTLEVDTPLLEEPLTGNVYVAQQNANPFGSLLAIYLVARGPGVLVKLAGRVDPDPVTGQLTTTFDNNPQLPFSSFKLRFKGGPTAPLVNPPTCGQKTVTTSLTPWSGNAAAHPSSTFAIDCPGVSAFAPAFDAGTLAPTGGMFSPFSLTIARRDGDKELKAIRSVRLPEGLLGRVASVPLCGEAQAAAGTCPEASRVGHVQVAAGAGSTPLWIPQAGKEPTGVYLTGPYKGAPYGLSVKVPAQAGPFDLGTVVVRSALRVDPRTAAITAETDDMPTILEGIPLRIREVRLIMDRPGFVFNPTSCAPKSIDARIAAIDGELKDVSSRFRAVDCAKLEVKPKLRLRLTGKRQMRSDGGHPGLRALLTQGSGEANLADVKVSLPLSLALDPDNAQSLCEYEDGLRVDCPESSIIGRATAVTPVLNEPLEGPVYFVKGVRIDPKTGARIRTLPTLLIPLRGEVAIDLRATSSVKRRKLITTFADIPDAPVSRFALRLRGGKHGILTTVRHPCRGKQRAEVSVRGHNNARFNTKPRIKTPCRKTKSNKAKGNGKAEPRRSTQSARD